MRRWWLFASVAALARGCVTTTGQYASFEDLREPVSFVDAVNVLYHSLGVLASDRIAACADLDDDGDVDFLDFVNVLYLQLGLRSIPEHVFPPWYTVARLASDTGLPVHMLAYEPREAGSERYPLLVFLHGVGEVGETVSSLSALERHGPLMMIAEGTWDREWVVVSPQAPVGTGVDVVRDVLEWAIAHLPVDPARVFLTGLSAGGYGVLNYLIDYDADPLVAKAAVGAAAVDGTADDREGPWGGEPSERKNLEIPYASLASRVPLWMFHAANDAVCPVAPVKRLAETYDHVNATVFADGRHSGGWIPMYASARDTALDATFGANTPFWTTVWDWFLS